MTEEINYSYDGGLYAEMVRNRTFNGRAGKQAAHWYMLEQGDAIGTMEIDDRNGPSGALQSSLMLSITQADAHSQAGVGNDGYWGMAVHPNTTYHGSFYARSATSDLGPVTISLINDTSGAVQATIQSSPIATDWKRYEFTLATGAQIAPSANNHLLLTVAHPGKLWLSLVSLFPPTFKDRSNGNRPDMMQLLQAMKPSFLRFPGGNYLEGDEIQNRFDWKTTLGPLADRPTHPGPWHYQSSDGMGLLEFLQWTEDLSIEPVLAVYAGCSLQGAYIKAGPFLQPYVEDALDEIEFVTGSPESKWGAKRAELGHPKPFPLHYVEIGNEDQYDHSGSYEGRFNQFNKAIKAKYPNLITIATTTLKDTKPDVRDDHYYLRTNESYQHVTQYDHADRSGPRIFIGEWATREGSPTTDLNAALGDAALMTSFERNSDIIVMASYAPLFTNVNPGGMQWESNLIGYDALSSYGSPSYYTQALFARYLGDTVPASTLTNAPDRFFYSVTMDSVKGRLYLKLVNGSSIPRPVAIQLTGAANIAHEATLETLSGTNPAVTNTITDPRRVVPMQMRLKNTDASFIHTVPPYSIQVIDLAIR
jgi:alpha-N-arabinofuranosidase